MSVIVPYICIYYSFLSIGMGAEAFIPRCLLGLISYQSEQFSG